MTSYRLPDGTRTTNQTRFLREWRELYAPIEQAFGCRCIAFDPSLQFVFPRNVPAWHLEVEIARRIVELIHRGAA